MLLREKIPQEIFLDLINIARSITDYDAEGEEMQEFEIPIDDDEEEE